jgi:hypothetical protein
MKTYTTYKCIPKHAIYIGSEDGSGCLDQYTADMIDQAIEPVRLKEDDGTYSYFDIAQEVTA